MNVRRLTIDDQPRGRICWVWCPGCNMAHAPRIIGEDGSMPDGPCWTWDDDLGRPTIQASLLVYDSVYRHSDGTQCLNWRNDYETETHTQGNCHSFITAGQWQFLGDSAHDLAGQTVLMVPLPDWLNR